MSYDVFCKRVADIVRQTGARVRFFNEDGKHIARCSGGVTIIGNPTCPNVLVKWGQKRKGKASLAGKSHWYAVGMKGILAALNEAGAIVVYRNAAYREIGKRSQARGNAE